MDVGGSARGGDERHVVGERVEEGEDGCEGVVEGGDFGGGVDGRDEFDPVVV